MIKITKYHCPFYCSRSIEGFFWFWKHFRPSGHPINVYNTYYRRNWPAAWEYYMATNEYHM